MVAQPMIELQVLRTEGLRFNSLLYSSESAAKHIENTVRFHSNVSFLFLGVREHVKASQNQHLCIKRPCDTQTGTPSSHLGRR